MVGQPSRRSGSEREDRPEVRGWSGGPLGGPGVIGSGREVLPEVREWSVGPHLCPGVVGRPSRRFGSGREALPEFRECSGVFPGGLGVVESGREAFPEVRERSGVVGNPPGFPGVAGRHFQRSVSGREAFPVPWSGREALPEVRQWSVSPHGSPAVYGRPSRRSGGGRKTLSEVRCRLGGAPGGPGVVG